MIGKLVGHTQLQTTARYAHLARDTVKASPARHASPTALRATWVPSNKPQAVDPDGAKRSFLRHSPAANTLRIS